MSFLKWLRGLPPEPISPKTPLEVVTPPILPENPPSDYRQLFDTMHIRSEWRARVNQAAEKVLKHRDRYQAIQHETAIPWYLVGCIHLLESSCRFDRHLHNGDPLGYRTIHAPAGRPRGGHPPFTWEESAEDALAGILETGIPLDTIGLQFGLLERYNGMGYRKRKIHTPYLWSGSDHYLHGKYVADGRFDPMAKSLQVGAACVYKVFQERAIIKF